MTEQCAIRKGALSKAVEGMLGSGMRPAPIIPGPPEALFRLGPIHLDGSGMTGSMLCGPWVLGPDGTPAAGSLGVLIDDVFGGVLMAGRPTGRWGVTTELAIDFCAAVPRDGTLTARAELVDMDDVGGLSHGSILDSSGRLLAVGSTRLRFVDGDVEQGSPSVLADGMAGRPMMEALGVSLVSEGAVTLEVEAGPAVGNPRGVMHGGVALWLSELAGLMVVQSRAHPLQTASIHMTYLRPGRLGERLRVTTEVVHRGRTLAIVRVACLRADGKICTVATVVSHAVA